MRNLCVYAWLLFSGCVIAQQSDFKHIDFSKADAIAKSVKSKRLYELNKLTLQLTADLQTDVEKLRSIHTWICSNVANDFSLYSLNERKRKKYVNDSIQLERWNSDFKQRLFKKLLKKKKTICTGYAYLLKEMCTIAGIKAEMVNGFGKTATTDFSELPMPNHTWNVVQLNNKWYVCDPTWSTGISFPEEGRFEFNYNDGYFLADPKIFNLNHFPLEKKYSLLEEPLDFNSFVQYPIIYGDAYHFIKDYIEPTKMHHELFKNDTLTFTYVLKKPIDTHQIKFITFNGSDERSFTPIIDYKNDVLTLRHQFKNKGYFDLHVYLENKLIATYTVAVKKSNNN